MVKPSRLFDLIVANPGQIVLFRDFERMLLATGFEFKRQKGSHRSYRHPKLPMVVTVQPNGKDAEPYQVRAFVAIVREHALEFDA